LMATDERRIEYIPLAELLTRLHPRNPKNHDLGAIIQSYKHHGYVANGVLDSRTGLFLAGHGRVEALSMMQKQKMEAPRGIRNGGADWLVPVQTGYESESDEAALAYLAADNKLTELGGWDEPALAELLQEIHNSGEISLEASGFDADDLDQILNDLGMMDEPTPDPGAQVDRAAELQEKWQVQRGDVWQVGRHRVMCGDSTCKDDVDRLMGGVRAVMVWTDPPYGVNYGDKIDAANPMGYRVRAIKNDDLTGGQLEEFIRSAYINAADASVPGATIYAACPSSSELPTAIASFLDSGFEFRWQLVWVKDQLVLSRADYHFRHENILYGWKSDAGHYFTDDRTQDSIFEFPRPKQSPEHPTMKPVELITRAITNSSRTNESVYDPFLGSGTTIVACEQTNRIGYGMEISEAYVAVTLQRLSDMGLQPKRADDE
jgi:DNA modification methylase